MQGIDRAKRRVGRLTGRNTLDTATTGETTDGRLGYALDVVTKNLSVTLGSAFAETLSTFSACVDASVLLVFEKDGRTPVVMEGGDDDEAGKGELTSSHVDGIVIEVVELDEGS